MSEFVYVCVSVCLCLCGPLNSLYHGHLIEHHAQSGSGKYSASLSLLLCVMMYGHPLEKLQKVNKLDYISEAQVN